MKDLLEGARFAINIRYLKTEICYQYQISKEQDGSFEGNECSPEGEAASAERKVILISIYYFSN